MKSATKIIGLLLIASMAIITNQGCKKYEEGPAISFRSRAARVANTWKVEKYIKNGVDETAQKYSASGDKRNYTETYTKDGFYSYSYIDDKNDSKSGSGKWEFQNKDNEIKRSGVSGQSTETLVILKLKEKSFWFWYMDGGDKKEFHLIPN